MNENKNAVVMNDAGGEINISEEVIASISSIAATEVEGVYSMATPGVDIGEILGKKNFTKGIKIQNTEAGLIVDAYICVKYGVIIQSVSEKVQDKIANALSSMASIHPISVNVHVVNISKSE